MTIQKTRWYPDTCSCVIEYEWDDTEPQETRQHTLKNIERCQAHNLVNSGEAYGNVIDENQSKNKAIGFLIESVPQLNGYPSQRS